MGRRFLAPLRMRSNGFWLLVGALTPISRIKPVQAILGALQAILGLASME